MKWSLLLLFLLIFETHASPFCFKAAGDKYHIDPLLLRSIAEVESGLNPKVTHANKRNGKTLSTDYGLMQINSTHLSELRQFGISRDDLLNKPCLNIHVGAWILAQQIAQGGVSWNSVGAYNAGFSEHTGHSRVDYSTKVYRHYRQLLLAERGIAL
ncbi:lytic transglycosylase domain-containing protein [Lelliottia aquatilis]|uniref:lytic transglycosylase domain-containing protein n=1 Tax=Lelliottia aquatilis TaxID=2080838 RepID=UPI001576C9EF|nr:lytic transglycosylase domain-containing protein [Lelliottia aquatilis]NTZ47720.1 lytic transglycosylase domain-containing protein [Lelliottia aquatilis]